MLAIARCLKVAGVLFYGFTLYQLAFSFDIQIFVGMIYACTVFVVGVLAELLFFEQTQPFRRMGMHLSFGIGLSTVITMSTLAGTEATNGEFFPIIMMLLLPALFLIGHSTHVIAAMAQERGYRHGAAMTGYKLREPDDLTSWPDRTTGPYRGNEGADTRLLSVMFTLMLLAELICLIFFSHRHGQSIFLGGTDLLLGGEIIIIAIFTAMTICTRQLYISVQYNRWYRQGLSSGVTRTSSYNHLTPIVRRNHSRITSLLVSLSKLRRTAPIS